MRMKVARKLGHWGAVCGLFVGALILAGCQTGSNDSFADLPPVPGATGAAPSTGGSVANTGSSATVTPRAITPDSPEIIKIGDVLTVTFMDIPTPPLPSATKVREDGTITLMLNQTFVAAGKTSGDLEREIRAAYVPKFYVTMTVTVFMQNGFYFVDGEVKAPNRYPYAGKTTVLKAIASAGDFTEYAYKKKVTLTRTDGHTLIINCIKALGDPTLDVEVYPNDKIHVPRRLF
jgi:polysaccharide export outer membrane protein